MQDILKIGEKTFKKYAWLATIFYIIGYILIRIQFAQHGICEVQIFKERYILASVLFIIFCSPIILFESILKVRREKHTHTKEEIILTTFALSIGMTFLITTFPAIFYSDNNYGPVADFNIFIIIGFLIVVSMGIFSKNLAKNNKIGNYLTIIAGILIIIGLSIGSYKNFAIKEEWLNMYITTFFILETIMVIRLIIEKIYVMKKSGEEKSKAIKFVKIGILLFALCMYGNFVFKFLPSEIGGGRLANITVETNDELLKQEIGEREVYLLDRSGDTYILVIEENKEEDLYKTIEVSKEKAVIGIEKQVVMQYFK